MLFRVVGVEYMEPSKKPLNVLVKQLNTNVVVTLKNGVQYKGTMLKCDGHMNLILGGATEFKQDQMIAKYGNILVRGNNVLYIAIETPQKIG